MPPCHFKDYSWLPGFQPTTKPANGKEREKKSPHTVSPTHNIGISVLLLALIPHLIVYFSASLLRNCFLFNTREHCSTRVPGTITTATASVGITIFITYSTSSRKAKSITPKHPTTYPPLHNLYTDHESSRQLSFCAAKKEDENYDKDQATREREKETKNQKE